MKKSRSAFDSFYVAEQLILGSPLSIVPENKIQEVIGALCSLRNESYTVNPDKQRIDTINSLINTLQSYIGIPKEKKKKTIDQNTTQISQQTQTQTQTQTQISQEEIDYLNYMIDSTLEDEDEIFPENEEQRKLIISMLKERKVAELEASNYYKVEKIDETIKNLQPPKIPNNEFLNKRLSVLTERLESIHQRFQQLSYDQQNDNKEMDEQQDEQYQNLLHAQKEEMAEFCQTLPQFDDSRNVRFSTKYLTMRANEKNYARGGDYDGATRLHQEADILEEKERHDAVNRIVQSSTLRRRHKEKGQELKRKCFIERWNQRHNDTNTKYNREFAVLKLQEESLQNQIASIQNKLNANNKNSSRISRANTSRY